MDMPFVLTLCPSDDTEVWKVGEIVEEAVVRSAMILRLEHGLTRVSAFPYPRVDASSRLVQSRP